VPEARAQLGGARAGDHAGVLAALGLWIDEGALSFVTTIFPLIGILRTNQSEGGQNDRRPSSKPGVDDGPVAEYVVPRARGRGGHCPGRDPPCLAVRRRARPYKSAVQKRFTAEYAEAAQTAPRGPDGARARRGRARVPAPTLNLKFTGLTHNFPVDPAV
jgi:hypothetical protein